MTVFRMATEKDAAALLAIYAPYTLETASFEESRLRWSNFASVFARCLRATPTFWHRLKARSPAMPMPICIGSAPPIGGTWKFRFT